MGSMLTVDCARFLADIERLNDRVQMLEAMLVEVEGVLCESAPMSWVADSDLEAARVWEVRAADLVQKIAKLDNVDRAGRS